MQSERFSFALKETPPSQWERFERLSSVFLASVFPTLRTVAAPSGDEGRDSELFSPEGAPTVVVQYSVAVDWRAKIVKTAKRLAKTIPGVKTLIYMSNQLIGADADDLKSNLFKNGLLLDVRDRNWFVERVNDRGPREAAAAEYSEAIATPILQAEGVIKGKATALDGSELRAAFLYLSLQWEDDTREKGLTKLSFEAIVRAVLRETDATHRLSRAEVLANVQELLPAHEPQDRERHTNAALDRLVGGVLKHWKKEDEFCLSHQERERLVTRLAQLEQRDELLEKELRRRLLELVGKKAIATDAMDSIVRRTRRVLEKLLLGRGEAFVSALSSGSFGGFGFDDMRDIIASDLAADPDKSALKAKVSSLISETIRSVVIDPGETIQAYLRSLADAYTLFSFLRETPDVQEVVKAMFADGDIWFDSSFILPVLLEEVRSKDERRFGPMLEAAHDAGLNLWITPGILDEIEGHVNKATACARMGTGWKGRIPFLLAGYTLAGRDRKSFASWTELFMDRKRPKDDIAEYLSEFFGIDVRDLEKEAENAPAKLKAGVESAWRAVHEGRRQARDEADALMTDRLISHDVESYLGVVMRRKDESKTPFGYNSWLVTFDRQSFDVDRSIKSELGKDAPDSPIMTVDFLANYLAIGPLRDRIPKETEARLPILLDIDINEFIPDDLLELAAKAREEAAGKPEYVIRRRVRDRLDEAKRRHGPLTRAGMAGVQDELRRNGPASSGNPRRDDDLDEV